MSERERLEINADDALRLLLDLMVEVDSVEGLPAHGLKVLLYLASQPDGSADQAADVAAKLGLSTFQMFRACDRLDADHLVIRRSLKSDRRAKQLSITPRGRSVVGKVDKATQSVVLKLAKAQLLRSRNSSDTATK
jgi:DNA-binding MarR family transcriptional regulator